jgi:hypothetical protein
MATLRRLLGLREEPEVCRNDCVSESETRYEEAMIEAERGMDRARRSSAQNYRVTAPSWEELLRTEERR